MSASRLSIISDDAGGLRASGVIDAHTADILSTELNGLGTDADIELHLGEIEFIDSSGLRALVTAHRNLDDAGHRLVLAGVSDAVVRLLEITGLNEHMHVRP